MADSLGSVAAELARLGRDAQGLAAQTGAVAGRETAAAVRAGTGPRAYAAVYARLALGVTLRPDPPGPPAVVVTGGRAFRSGASIDSLAGRYEYGHPAGDLRRGRHPGARRGSQFPPPRAAGWWLGPAVDARGEQIAGRWADRLADRIEW